jgi:hypothetical protein
VAAIAAVCLFKWSGVRGDTHGHRYITLDYVCASLEKELLAGTRRKRNTILTCVVLRH